MILQILTYSDADIPEFRNFYTRGEFIAGFYREDDTEVDDNLEKIMVLLIAGQWILVKLEPHLEDYLRKIFIEKIEL